MVKKEGGRKLFRLRRGFARRGKDLPDERLMRKALWAKFACLAHKQLMIVLRTVGPWPPLMRKALWAKFACLAHKQLMIVLRTVGPWPPLMRKALWAKFACLARNRLMIETAVERAIAGGWGRYK